MWGDDIGMSILRIYIPKPEVIEDHWKNPPLVEMM